MKIPSIPMACLAVLTAVPASLAIQPPADDAPPPPSLDPRDVPPAPREMREARDRVAEEPPPRQVDDAPAVQAGFLGINVSEIPELLDAHIDIPDGQGVLVRVVSPGSAAANAGLRVHDVILKVADKPVASHQDLSNIISGFAAGDPIEIELLRKGATRKIQAVLDARPVNPGLPAPGFERQMGNRGFGIDDLFFEDMPQDQAGRIRDMIEQNLRAMREPGGLLEDEAFQDAFRGMREQMRNLLDDPGPFAPLNEDGGFGNIRMNAGATVRLMDDQGSVEIKAEDGSKEVTVRDRENEIVWTGPWDTDQDKAAAPDDVRDRIERLKIDGFHQGNGLKLQFFGDR